MQDYISDWFIPMDFGNDMPDEEPSGEDNFNLIKIIINNNKHENIFECKIRYEKVAENGMNKKVSEQYLVDALSFTEAEARIISEMTPFISGEFTVSDIKRSNYSELFPSEKDGADLWFKCKLYYITLDEKSGAEKRHHAICLFRHPI